MSDHSVIAVSIKAGEGAERQAFIKEVQKRIDSRQGSYVELLDLLKWLRKRDEGAA